MTYNLDSVKVAEATAEMLAKRGVTKEEIAKLVFYLQKDYFPDLSMDICISNVEKVLSKREVQNAILTGVQLDMLAEEGKLAQPLQEEPFRRHLGRESSRALWELTWMPMVMPTRTDCPVLATHGELDRMVPLDSLDVIERYFGADRMVFEAMGHCPMLEKRWEEAASRIAAWLDERLYSEIDDEQLD